MSRVPNIDESFNSSCSDAQGQIDANVHTCKIPGLSAEFFHSKNSQKTASKNHDFVGDYTSLGLGATDKKAKLIEQRKMISHETKPVPLPFRSSDLRPAKNSHKSSSSSSIPKKVMTKKSRLDASDKSRCMSQNVSIPRDSLK